MVASLTGPYLDQSKLAIVILMSAWQSDYFKALLKPSLCDSSDGLLLGRRPGGRWTILSSLSIRQGLPARWAGSYLPVSLGQKWASYLQVGLWEMDELILGRRLGQIILILGRFGDGSPDHTYTYTWRGIGEPRPDYTFQTEIRRAQHQQESLKL